MLHASPLAAGAASGGAAHLRRASSSPSVTEAMPPTRGLSDGFFSTFSNTLPEEARE